MRSTSIQRDLVIATVIKSGCPRRLVAGNLLGATSTLVIASYAKGCSKRAISRDLGIAYKTVLRWLRAGQFPERKPPSGRRQKAAEFADYLQQRWSEGCHNATQLYREIRVRGYKAAGQWWATSCLPGEGKHERPQNFLNGSHRSTLPSSWPGIRT
jgi:hypothetical protein